MSTQRCSRFATLSTHGRCSFALQWSRGLADSAGIVASPVPNVQRPYGNLVEPVFSSFSKWNDRIAVECAATARRYTYAQLQDRVARWSGLLKRLGVSTGHTVAVALPNCPEYPVVFFGTLALGAAVTTIHVDSTAEEIARQMSDSGADVLVGEPLLAQTLEVALKLHRRPTHLVMNGPSASATAINLWEVLQDPSVPFEDPIVLTGHEPAVLPYSRGPTGLPRGVIFTHESFSAHIPSTIHPYFTLEEGERQDAYTCVLPFSRIYGLGPVMTCGLHVGAKLLTSSKFNPITFVQDITKHKVTVLHLVPALLNFLLQSPTVTPHALRHVRNVICAATSVPSEVVAALKEKTNSDLLFQMGYGMTEVLATTKVPVHEERWDTIGQLLPNVTAKVVSTETGDILSSNEDGEICIKTPAMMKGYHNNPAATTEAIDEEGWLHTGALGHYDDEGFFRVVGPVEGLTKTDGLKRR